MKSILMIGIALGFAAATQANTITLTRNVTLDGNYAYMFEVTAADLGLSPGETISDFSLNFNNISLTSSGQNEMHVDLINYDYATGRQRYSTYYDGDAPGDYFTTASTSGHTGFSRYGGHFGNRGFRNRANATIDSLGTLTLNRRGDANLGVDVIGLTLNDLNQDLVKYGAFDIAVDPDCGYKSGSITCDYTKGSPCPDTGFTAGLLGISFLGLIAFRRKYADR